MQKDTTTVSEVVRSNQQRHNHYDPENIQRCHQCGLFVKKPASENGMCRYHCDRCGPVLEYRKT